MHDCNNYIAENRIVWDAEHPKHDVVVRGWDDRILAVIKNDNSVMGSDGPMLTEAAKNMLSLCAEGEIVTIDGNHSDGWLP